MARVVACLTRLQPNILLLTKEKEWQEAEEEQVEEAGLPTLLYWVLGEGQGSQELPQVLLLFPPAPTSGPIFRQRAWKVACQSFWA